MINRVNAVTMADIKPKLAKLGHTQVRCKIEAFKIICQEVAPTETTGDGDTSGSTNAKSKKEKMCWNKGNWLSFMANIARQIEYLGPLHLIWYVIIQPWTMKNYKIFFFLTHINFKPIQNREGRNERMIGRPKDILVAMRTKQSYRETKMILLQKLTGVDFLSFTFDDVKGQRDWFSGIYKYHDEMEIVKEYVSGSPLTAFHL